VHNSLKVNEYLVKAKAVAGGGRLGLMISLPLQYPPPNPPPPTANTASCSVRTFCTDLCERGGGWPSHDIALPILCSV